MYYSQLNIDNSVCIRILGSFFCRLCFCVLFVGVAAGSQGYDAG